MQKNNKVLIEVAAQHPLIDGKPGEEFEHRLKKGIQIYNDEKRKGNNPIIYIPGSLHSVKKNGEWETDKKALSESGRIYLIENGIPEENIRANESNERFKGDGVYNSGDECLVATLIAKDEEIDRIVSIASPVQISRKALFYLEYGYLPEMHGVGLDKTYHNYIGEVFWSLYITYFIDHTWQESFLAAKTREERDKNYKITREIRELIDTGIFIPENIKTRKEQMMLLYRNSQCNMEKRASNKGIMVGVELENEQDEEKTQEKINNVLLLCKQQKNNEENIIICIQGKESIKTEQILRKIVKEKIKIIRLKSYEEELEYFKTEEMSKIYHITDSPKVMSEAILAVKSGILPIIYSVPNKNISYVDETDKLYSDILKIKEKDNENRIIDGEYNSFE